MLIAIPDLLQARRVLCVQPHYDDNDIAAGGTIARLAAGGTEVFYLTVTDDLAGVIDTTLPDEAARAQLVAEQEAAGREIGVAGQYWLDYPDAGAYDYFDVRRDIIRHIRMLRPDFVLTVDPWMPYEAHRDHQLTGKAAAEAALLYGVRRLATDPAIDAAFEPYALGGIGFYFTAKPNVHIDVCASRDAKHRALDCYRAQFSEPELALLHAGLEVMERRWGAASGAGEFCEGLKVVHPRHLHCNPDAEEMCA